MRLKSQGELNLRIALSLILPILFALSACTNNLNIDLNSLYNSGNTIQAVPNSGDGSSGTFVLSRVIKDTLNPTSQLDLIGDGTGAFDTLCAPTGKDTSSTGDTVCQCSFSYSTSSAPNQQVFSRVIYHETNLLRCSYANIPTDVVKLTVSINLMSAGTNSNSVTLNLGQTSGVSIDVTNPNSFVQPIRYQCRDVIRIPYLFDPSNLYDPFQSEDPHLAYTLDFYASNLGDAISQYISSGVTNYNCPPILNPVQYLTDDALNEFNNVNRVNLKLYSKAPLPGGGQLIYPPNGSIDRSTFYLAKQRAGIFSVPVNAYIAPTLFTSEGGGGPQPLGYGAHPVPIGVGTGQETCDTSTSIPIGFHWMKLWLFRAGLSQRHYATSGSTNKSIAYLVGLACNPGDWSSSSAPYSPVFQQCAVSITNGGISHSIRDLTDQHYFADRILGSEQCIRLDKDTSNTASPTYCTDALLANTPGGACGINGEDYWQFEDGVSTSLGCKRTPLVDPMGVCSKGSTTFTPLTYDLGTGDLDASSSGDSDSRSDFLFVVTPHDVNTTDMQDISSGSASLPYQPFRFLTVSDCGSDQPGLAPSGSCLSSNTISNYGLKLHDVGTNGNPPANSTEQPIFPICVLQPD